ncbi:MAG: hypothetical protein CR979_02840 [Propionibacterium sp.]|nr:MAG: hypothetical protein CR979_02840 [Propionibacterium sp.]
MLFFAVTSPLTALYTPEIMELVVPEVKDIVPEPTFTDAYAQWLKNLQQLGLFIWFAITAGLIAGERKAGTVQLVCTKPISRATIVLAGAGAYITFFAIVLSFSSALVWLITKLAFEKAPIPELASAVAVWFLLAVLLFGVVLIVSASTESSLAAVAAGFISYVIFGLLSLWPAAERYSPIGLVTAPAKLLAGENIDLIWPIITGLLLILVLFAVAILAFRRAEL